VLIQHRYGADVRSDLNEIFVATDQPFGLIEATIRHSLA